MIPGFLVLMDVPGDKGEKHKTSLSYLPGFFGPQAGVQLVNREGAACELPTGGWF